MTKMLGFFSLLSEQQRDQLLRNPQDFAVGDPAYLLIMDRAGSRRTGEDNVQKTEKDS
jgi:predicted AAA+ superfamily ATPase